MLSRNINHIAAGFPMRLTSRDIDLIIDGLSCVENEFPLTNEDYARSVALTEEFEKMRDQKDAAQLDLFGPVPEVRPSDLPGVVYGSDLSLSNELTGGQDFR